MAGFDTATTSEISAVGQLVISSVTSGTVADDSNDNGAINTNAALAIPAVTYNALDRPRHRHHHEWRRKRLNQFARFLSHFHGGRHRFHHGYTSRLQPIALYQVRSRPKRAWGLSPPPPISLGQQSSEPKDWL